MTAAPIANIQLENFPAQTYDKLRFGDTDRQGHVNNSTFATFCETGRSDMIHGKGVVVFSPGCNTVVARVAIDFRAEVFWPGTVEIGTAIKAVGRSSITFFQAMFQNGKCVATAESVVVQVDGGTGRPAPLNEETRALLAKFELSAEAV
jgi:acyl-CoA thioester hydrolase